MTRREIEKLRAALWELACLAVACADCGAGAGRPCVTHGTRARVPGTPIADHHTPRRQSAGDAYARALLELGDQVCPWCGQRVGAPNRLDGWHQCKRSPQLLWVRDELARLRQAVVDAVGEEAARELLAERALTDDTTEETSG
jgi:hypothetical protein